MTAGVGEELAQRVVDVMIVRGSREASRTLDHVPETPSRKGSDRRGGCGVQETAPFRETLGFDVWTYFILLLLLSLDSRKRLRVPFNEFANAHGAHAG
jgi:hypothetical protein